MSDSDEPRHTTVSRRTFLAGAAGVAASAVLPLATAETLARKPHRVPPLDPRVAAREAAAAARHAATAMTTSRVPLSIGYVQGSAAWPKLGARPWTHSGHLGGSTVVPATSLPSGDLGLVGHRLTVTVHGLYPHHLVDHSIRTIALDADFDAGNPDSVRKYFAWTARYDGVRAVSGRAVFELEASAQHHFGFELGTATKNAARVAVAQLVVGAAARVPKLREGCYLLALEPGTWDTPRRAPAVGSAQWRTRPSLVVTIHG
jgi:hypothetical protein